MKETKTLEHKHNTLVYNLSYMINQKGKNQV